MNQSVIASSNKSITILLACLAVLCTQAGMMMYVPSMPYISSAFDTTYGMVVLTFTSYLLGYGFAMLLGGGISDQLGRRKSYLFALALFSFSSLFIVVVKSIYLFIFLRLLQGIGGGSCAVIGRSSVRDVCDGKQLIRGMSCISITFNTSMGLFQFIGGLVQTYFSYKADFIFMFLFSLVLFVIFFFYEMQVEANTDGKLNLYKILQNYLAIIKERNLVYLATAAGMGYSILLVFNILGFGYLHTKLAISADMIGVFGFYFSITYLIGGIFLNLLIHHYKLSQIILFGQAIILLSGVLSILFAFLHLDSIYFILFPSLVGVFGQAVFYPSCMSKAVEPFKSSAGSASSLFGFTQQMTGFILSTLSGWMPYDSVYSLSIMLLLIALCTIGLCGRVSLSRAAI